jgi:hypothetical protein
MTLLLLEQVAQDCVPHLDLQRQDSTLLAYRNSFPLEVIQLLHREVSMLRLESECGYQWRSINGR